MTLEEAKMTIYANCIYACEKAGFDLSTICMVDDALRTVIAIADRKTEPQYDFGEYADRLWKIAYERGKREALEQTEPTISKMEQVEQRSCDTCKNRDIEGWKNPCLGCTEFTFYEPKDEPQTEVDWKQRLCDMYGANRKSFDEAWEKYEADKVTDEPQTEPLHTCSVNGRPYSECSSCEHFKCTADEPQTDCAWR